MMILKVKDKEYKVKFGYNSFCDTDLMDRTAAMLQLFDTTTDNGLMGFDRIRELFVCVRDLLFVGFKKYNPVDDISEIGDILDDYQDEETEDEKHGIMELFSMIAEELMNEGFLASMMQETEQENKKVTNIPQDHKKPQKK